MREIHSSEYLYWEKELHKISELSFHFGMMEKEHVKCKVKNKGNGNTNLLIS
jgi:hypothetical protein